MQTFLPYSSFARSAETLDYKRLGKQRVEAMQILNVLKRGSGGWANHPAVIMWRGYEDMLGVYMNFMIGEWIDRGYNNTMQFFDVPDTPMRRPFWLGDPAFHASHRAALLYKDPEHYGKFGWTEEPKIDYVWPVGGRDEYVVHNKIVDIEVGRTAVGDRR